VYVQYLTYPFLNFNAALHYSYRYAGGLLAQHDRMAKKAASDWGTMPQSEGPT